MTEGALVVGDGMVEKADHVKQGDLSSQECYSGVRAFVVARNRRNWRGAKGGRKVEARSHVDPREIGDSAREG
jgi:hypothetical protein